MDDTLDRLRLPVANIDAHCLATTGAGGLEYAASLKHSNDAKTIPDARSKKRTAAGAHQKWTRDGGKGVGHEHFTAGWLQDNRLAGS